MGSSVPRPGQALATTSGVGLSPALQSEPWREGRWGRGHKVTARSADGEQGGPTGSWKKKEPSSQGRCRQPGVPETGAKASWKFFRTGLEKRVFFKITKAVKLIFCLIKN